MVSKLKELSEDDLEDISNFLSETIEKKIQASVKSQKEILDMDVSIEISYPDENGELDVDASIEIDTDELSDLSNERIDEIIDESYLELDEYITVEQQIAVMYLVHAALGIQEAGMALQLFAVTEGVSQLVNDLTFLGR